MGGVCPAAWEGENALLTWEDGTCLGFHSPVQEGHLAAAFDEPNLVSAAGLVPVMALARRAGLRRLADQWMSVPTDKGANPGFKICSLVAGMAAGADSIESCRRRKGDSAVDPRAPAAG